MDQTFTLQKWVTLVAYLVMIIWLSRIMVIWVISLDLPAYYTLIVKEKDISIRTAFLKWKSAAFQRKPANVFYMYNYLQMAWMKAILMCWENIFVGGPIHHGKWPRFSQLNVTFRPTSCYIDDLHYFSADLFCNVIWPRKKIKLNWFF